MLSYGAGFALWTALALTKVSGREEGGGAGSPLAGRRRAWDTRAGSLRTGTARGRGWGLSPGHRRVSQSSPRSPQAAPGQAAGCSANLTERSVAGQSVRLRWGAAGRACNFSLSGRSEDGEAAGCQPAPQGNGTYGCTLRGLEAGTWYHLRIEPLAGGEPLNISVQTGKGAGTAGARGGMLGFSFLSPCFGRLQEEEGGTFTVDGAEPSSPALEFSLASCQK